MAAVCLIAAGLNEHAPVTRLLSSRPFVWVGLISYPLYLMHWPVMILIKESVFNFALTWRIFGFCLSFLLAWMVYRFVETPIRTGQIFTAQTGFIRMTFSLSALLIATAFGIWSSKGLPQRFDPQVAEVMAYREDGALLYRHCTDQLARSVAQPCILGDTDAQPDMLVFGDSHANAFAAAISQWLKRQDRAAYFHFRTDVCQCGISETQGAWHKQREPCGLYGITRQSRP